MELLHRDHPGMSKMHLNVKTQSILAGNKSQDQI